MKVLLTGGAGFIGSHTAVELINAGYEVIIADNLSNSREEAIKRIETITGKRPIFYKINVEDKKELSKIFKENKIESVVHFAGLKSVPESTTVPLKYYRNNLDTTLTLLEVMEEYGCNHIVFSSSATVYGDNNPVPFTENMPLGKATNPYGSTKLMIENILEDVSKANKELSVVTLRYFNPISAHPSGLIGEDPNGIPNNLMPYITQVAVKKRDKLTVYGDDYDTVDGTGVRDYIHVVDLAKGHLKALEYCKNHKGIEAINLGTGRGISVLELVNTFKKVNGVDIPFLIGKRRAGDIDICYADASKAEKLLNWKVDLTVEDMCTDAWNWQKKNPNGYN